MKKLELKKDMFIVFDSNNPYIQKDIIRKIIKRKKQRIYYNFKHGSS